MADAAMIARLAGMIEFAELASEFEDRKQQAVAKLGQKAFANPEEHDRLEAERLKAYYRGVDAVLALPLKTRAALETKEQSGRSR